jgi:hypothetical protein
LDRTARARRALASSVALAALLVPTATLAQTTDPELSCVPDTVAADGTTTCAVAGVAASRAIVLELRSDGATIATANGVAGTDGAASIALAVPTTAPPGDLTVALRGTSLTVALTVEPARPSGVSAGLGPSSGDVTRTLPAAVLLAGAVALGAAALPGLRRRATDGTAGRA